MLNADAIVDRHRIPHDIDKVTMNEKQTNVFCNFRHSFVSAPHIMWTQCSLTAFFFLCSLVLAGVSAARFRRKASIVSKSHILYKWKCKNQNVTTIYKLMPGTVVCRWILCETVNGTVLCAPVHRPLSQLVSNKKKKRRVTKRRKRRRRKKKKHVKCIINHFYANVTISRPLRVSICGRRQKKPARRNYRRRRRWRRRRRRRRWRPNSFVSFTISQCNPWANKN